MTNAANDIRILLVEDDHDDALIIASQLRKMTRFRASITVETDLDQALEMATEQAFDAVFLDYYWGSFKADEVLRRQGELTRAIPVIVITSTDDFSVNESVIEAGAWDFITKTDLTPKLLERTVLHAIQRKRHEQEMHRLIRHDSLTGLSNRLMFEEQLKRAVSRAKREGTRCAVLAMDLDDFKQVNDSLGHDVGDLLLRLVADRLQRGLREEDILARLGGDEFAVLIENTESMNHLRIIAEKLLEALRAPTPIRGISSRVTGSFGIAIYPDHGQSPLEMMRYADIALYAAKDDGRNRVNFFNDELEASLLSGLELEQDLRRAIDQQEFVPYFQPRYFTADHTIAGVEVLMRWQHHELGMITPDRFIPAAERSSMMLEMDRALIRKTFELLATHDALPDQQCPYRIAFNITAAQLLDGNFPGDMEQLVHYYGLPCEVVELEIVERVLVERVAQETLRGLRDKGFGLAIDDFGTGFSSFAYLRDLPVTCLKIDRSFISDIHHSEACLGICEAIYCVGKRLGLSVVGEGVETEEQLTVLRDMGVESVQGFFWDRPMDFDHWNQRLRGLKDLEASNG